MARNGMVDPVPFSSEDALLRGDDDLRQAVHRMRTATQYIIGITTADLEDQDLIDLLRAADPRLQFAYKD